MKKLISLLMVVLVFSSILCVPAAALENVALNKPTGQPPRLCGRHNRPCQYKRRQQKQLFCQRRRGFRGNRKRKPVCQN